MVETKNISNNWTFLPMEKVFKITEDTQAINLQGIIPDNARKIKFYLAAHSGNNKGQDNHVVWTFGTITDKIKFEMHPYGQPAWSTNSSNEKLNIQNTKEITVDRNGNFPNGNFSFKLTLLGYK